MEDLIQTPVVVRSPNWLGDAIMAFPAVNSLRRHLKDAPLTVAAPAALTQLWELCPFVDHVLPLNNPKNLLHTASHLKAGCFATSILLTNSLRTAAEARIAGIPSIYGYAGDGRNFLLKKAIERPEYDPALAHHKFYYLHLLEALKVATNAATPALKIPPISKKENILAIFPGAEYGPAKRWPAKFFAQIAQQFKDERRARVILFGAKKDVLAAAEVASEIPWVENLTGQTSFGEMLEHLISARLVLCNDSGAMHISSVLGVPTVAIFGSTDPNWTSPIGKTVSIQRHHVPCSPCFLRDCPLDFACMLKLTPEKIWPEATLLWDKAGK